MHVRKNQKEALGRLPLIPGMPVMITENLSMENKIVNGSEGVLTDIVYKTEPEGREAVCAYIKVTSSPITIEHLPTSVVPIFPKSVQFTHRLSKTKSIHINRTQLPLVPAWAFTDYKVQGASMTTVIIDLVSARGIQNVYVMLSCATGLQNPAVYRWFTLHQAFSRLQEDLWNELNCIAHLNEQTHHTFIGHAEKQADSTSINRITITTGVCLWVSITSSNSQFISQLLDNLMSVKREEFYTHHFPSISGHDVFTLTRSVHLRSQQFNF